MTFLQKNHRWQKEDNLRRTGKGKTDRVAKITACLLMLAVTAAGCGKVEEPVPVELSVGDMKDLQDESAQQTQNQSVGTAQMEGDVLSVSQDSFVVARNETFTEDGASYMVGAAPGYEDEEDKITVRVAGSCAYQYKTVKNGGINPEDVSIKEGSYADLQEGLLVVIQGSWQDDGSFLADTVVMSKFV